MMIIKNISITNMLEDFKNEFLNYLIETENSKYNIWFYKLKTTQGRMLY